MSTKPSPANRELALFAATLLAVGAAGGIFGNTFNNYLNDSFELTAGVRSLLELPRELPGFLCAIMAAALAFLPEARVGVVALSIAVTGLAGLAAFGGSFAPMIVFMVMQSSGEHLLMPVRSSIGMQLARDENSLATRLGQLGSLETAATILGSALVWVAVDHFHVPYRGLFAIAAACAALGLIPLARMRLRHSQPAGPSTRRFVWRREYRLYYLLCVLFGARKQIFITFAPWVLVKVFDEPPSTFARLAIIGAISGLLLKPALGRFTDRCGERLVLMADAAILIVVCIGYGFAREWFAPHTAVLVTYLCYCLDQILFATGMARATYLRKIAVSPDDVTPTLSLGVSIDHVVSMTIPSLGGAVWMAWGYPWVFAGAAVLAALNLVACAQLGRRPRPGSV